MTWPLAISSLGYVFFLACADNAVKTLATTNSNPPNRDAGPSAECTLGTADHCGSCATACPGTDDDTTARTCTSTAADGVCTVLCRGEYYDVNGDASDGCEQKDEPVQDSPSKAVVITLPGGPNDDPTYQTNPRNLIAYVLSDNRTHEVEPVTRAKGREDWYLVKTTPPGLSTTPIMVACLSIAQHAPADNQVELCVSNDQQTTFEAAACKTVTTATSGDLDKCVSPTKAPLKNGQYYLRVRKLQGSATATGYALYIKN